MQAVRGSRPAIVVGTDGRASSRAAVQRAAQLAVERGAELHIVHGFRRTSRSEIKRAQLRFSREIGYSQMGRFDVDGIGDSETIARAILEDAAHDTHTPGLPVFLHALNAAPHTAVRAVALHKKAHLIVVGNKPVRSPLKMFRKAIHEMVQDNPPCPVHVVDTSPYWRTNALPAPTPPGAQLA